MSPDTAYQEQLGEELVDSKAPFYTPISPEPLYGEKDIYLLFI